MAGKLSFPDQINGAMGIGYPAPGALAIGGSQYHCADQRREKQKMPDIHRASLWPFPSLTATGK